MEISEKEIREKLLKHYDSSVSPSQDIRKLHKTSIYNNYGTVGTIFYSLGGSPPKGYAIYIPDLRQLNFYDLTGRRFKELGDIWVKETLEKADWLVEE